MKELTIKDLDGRDYRIYQSNGGFELECLLQGSTNDVCFGVKLVKPYDEIHFCEKIKKIFFALVRFKKRWIQIEMHISTFLYDMKIVPDFLSVEISSVNINGKA